MYQQLPLEGLGSPVQDHENDNQDDHIDEPRIVETVEKSPVNSFNVPLMEQLLVDETVSSKDDKQADQKIVCFTYFCFHQVCLSNKALKNDRIILGIDPGTNIMGYGLIHHKGSKIELIAMGVLKLGKLPDHGLKLKKIFERVSAIISEYKPDELAIEAPFFGKNVQSMLKLGRAQGVAMAAALNLDVPIFEYSPRKIKQSITGKGSASKEQVAAMLTTLLSIQDPPKYMDATDGLAVAVCHYFQRKPGVDGEQYGSWKSYISKNPDKLK